MHAQQVDGFTLVEVMVATGLLTTVTLGGLALAASTWRLAGEARTLAGAVAAAQCRLAQLEALSWHTEAGPGAVLDVTDTTTDLGGVEPVAAGSGLLPVGETPLWISSPSFADFVDDASRWVGRGTSPPPSGFLVRRWAVLRSPLGPDDQLVVAAVRVVPRDRAAAPPGPAGPGEVVIVRARARTVR
jgi:type II secretory pathway pseudopilin PulG